MESKRTDSMQAYIDIRREEMLEHLKEERLLPDYQDRQRATKISLALDDAALRNARVIVADDLYQNVIRSLIDELSGASEAFFQIPMRNYWVESAKVLEFKDLNFYAKTLFFRYTGDLSTIDLAKKETPADWHDAMDRLSSYDRSMCDVADGVGDIVFSFCYNHVSQKWGFSPEYHICPWGRCVAPDTLGTKKPCKDCELIRGYLTSYLCAAIRADQAARGEITETEPVHMVGKKSELQNSIDSRIVDLTKKAAASSSLLERSFLPAFISAYDYLEVVTLDQMRIARKAAFEIRATRFLFIFQKEILRRSNIILIDDTAQSLIEHEIARRGGVLSDECQNFVPASYGDVWIKLARPLVFPDLSWSAGVFFLNKPNDGRIIKYLEPDLPAELRPMAQQMRDNSSIQFCADAISLDELLVKFSFEYEPGQRWLGSEEQHQCAYGRVGCGWRKMCLECQSLFNYLHGYLGMVLRAHAGEFRGSVLRSDVERVKVEKKAFQVKQKGKQKRQPSQWLDRRIYTVSVDISEPYIENDVDDEPIESNVDAGSSRPHWATLHAPGDIEEEKKVQGAYKRYGNWVFPKKERVYRRLKPGVAPVRIEHLKSSDPQAL